MDEVEEHLLITKNKLNKNNNSNKPLILLLLQLVVVKEEVEVLVEDQAVFLLAEVQLLNKMLMSQNHLMWK